MNKMITLPLKFYKWTRYLLWGMGTFGLAFGFPFVVESLFDVSISEWLDFILFFLGFFTGGISTPILLGKILFAQCPRCKKPMRLAKTVGTKERYECLDCWQQYEIDYPKTGVHR